MWNLRPALSGEFQTGLDIYTEQLGFKLEMHPVPPLQCCRAATYVWS
jgi:hypothetical protein